MARIRSIYPDWFTDEAILELGAMAHAIQNGLPFAGLETEKCNVLYLAPERGALDIRHRFYAPAMKHGGEPVACSPAAISMYGLERNSAPQVAALADHLDADVVFIDTQGAAMPGGDRSSFEDASTYIETVKWLASTGKDGRAVITCTHPPKDKSSSIAGSGDYHNMADCVFVVAVDEDDDSRKLVVEKAKSEGQGREFPFELDIVEVARTPKRNRPVTGAFARFDGVKERERVTPLSKLTHADIDRIRMEVTRRWDEGNPFSPHPQSRGRYISKWIASEYRNLSREDADFIIEEWMLNERIVLALRDAKRHLEGLKWVK